MSPAVWGKKKNSSTCFNGGMINFRLNLEIKCIPFLVTSFQKGKKKKAAKMEMSLKFYKLITA